VRLVDGLHLLRLHGGTSLPARVGCSVRVIRLLRARLFSAPLLSSLLSSPLTAPYLLRARPFTLGRQAQACAELSGGPRAGGRRSIPARQRRRF
jgi:hypothetical protein